MTDRMPNIPFNSLESFQFDLFHMLNVSNVSLVLYDRMIGLMKLHQCTIQAYGTGSLMNKKFYNKYN